MRCLFVSLAFATCVATPPASATPLAAGVEFVPGRFVPGEQPDGNTLVFTTFEEFAVAVDEHFPGTGASS